jgi:3-phenylpropionate/cinnamic acid dioxygenase small subunit
MALTWEEKLDLQDLMARYAAAIDMDEGTEEEFLDIFTEDAVMESPMSGHNVGTVGLKSFFAKAMENRKQMMMRHYITNYRITGDGDQANIKAYFINLVTYRKPRRPKMPRVTEFLFAGLYDCTAVKSGGTWRIQRRIVRIDTYSPEFASL